MPHVRRSPTSLPIQKKTRLSQHVQFEPIIQFRFRILMACCHVADISMFQILMARCHVADISMFQILMAHCHVAEFPCSCSWAALLAVGSWKIYFRLRFLVTRCYDGDFQCCWSRMARLAIIASRRRSGWHVVMHAVDVRSAAGLSAKDSCRRRASWRKRVRQWSVVYGQWYQKSNYQKKQWRRLLERLWPRKKKRKFLPS